MTEGRVVDTNVLIVASAADGASPFRWNATPVEEADLRERVLDWLQKFEGNSEFHLVIDFGSLIFREYRRKLTEQDYGLQVILNKIDRNQVIRVELEKDEHGDAVLSSELAEAVPDRADRKMVAAVLAANPMCDSCKLTNACDTDWLECEKALEGADVRIENLLQEWLTNKWNTRHDN